MRVILFVWTLAFVCGSQAQEIDVSKIPIDCRLDESTVRKDIDIEKGEKANETNTEKKSLTIPVVVKPNGEGSVSQVKGQLNPEIAVSISANANQGKFTIRLEDLSENIKIDQPPMSKARLTFQRGKDFKEGTYKAVLICQYIEK